MVCIANILDDEIARIINLKQFACVWDDELFKQLRDEMKQAEEQASQLLKKGQEAYEWYKQFKDTPDFDEEFLDKLYNAIGDGERVVANDTLLYNYFSSVYDVIDNHHQQIICMHQAATKAHHNALAEGKTLMQANEAAIKTTRKLAHKYGQPDGFNARIQEIIEIQQTLDIKRNPL